MFSNGYESFAQLRRKMVHDILSDDEDDRKKKTSRIKEESEEEDQIFSGGDKQKKQQKQIYENIQFGIDMLLESDEDEGAYYKDTGIMEKDLDNFF